MDIRLFSFTSLLIGLFCTSSWASNHNRNSGKNANLGQDSIPSDCLPRDIFLNSSSNPTFLTIKPSKNFLMGAILRLYNYSNGEQSISEGIYVKNFVLKGTGEEQYRSFQVNITAQQNRIDGNSWRIDLSTESKNIDIREPYIDINIDIDSTVQPDIRWMSGHAFHSMTIFLEPDSGSWYDTKCWEQIRDGTRTTTTTPRTTSTESSTK